MHSVIVISEILPLAIVWYGTATFYLHYVDDGIISLNEFDVFTVYGEAGGAPTKHEAFDIMLERVEQLT